MAFVTPPTFSSGAVLTAAQLNILSDDLNYLKGIADGVTISGVGLRRAATQSIANDSDVAVSWDTEVQDWGGWWSSGTTVTVPAGAIPGDSTMIAVQAVVQAKFASNATGKRTLRVLKEGSSVDYWKIPALDDDVTSIAFTTFSTTIALDDWTVQVRQNSGGALNITEAHFWLLRYAPAN